MKDHAPERSRTTQAQKRYSVRGYPPLNREGRGKGRCLVDVQGCAEDEIRQIGRRTGRG